MHKKRLVGLGLGALALCCVAFGLFLLADLYFQGHLLPGTYVLGINASGLSAESAAATLDEIKPPKHMVIFSGLTGDIITDTQTLGYAYRTQPKLEAIIDQYRQQPLFKRGWLLGRSLIRSNQVTLKPDYDTASLKQYLELASEALRLEGELPQATLGTSGVANSLSISRGGEGAEIDIDNTLRSLTEKTTDSTVYVAIVTKPITRKLTDDEYKAAQKRARALVGNSLRLVDEQGETAEVIGDQTLIHWLALPEGINQSAVNLQANQLATKLSRQPTDAEFKFDPETLRVDSFQPDLPGRQIDAAQLEQILVAGVQQLEATTSATLQMTVSFQTTPAAKRLADNNNLGIDERIGLGESAYAHSIPSRVHNVALAAQRINWTIIQPDQEFSFNKALGEVSKATGFQPAYVIKSGQTILGDGGGVCQVSSTVFRAVLNAGLKVTKRLPHSYRVSYYELDRKPGIDATVYAGDVDLRFINDTGHHILMRTETDSKRLTMKVELFGTSDGRQTQIIDHQVWGITPPLPTEYIVDASLPPGAKKQVDWSAPGAKASFTNVIKDKFGNVIREDTYKSTYRAWAAKYLVGPTP